jgi:cytidine deaminase
VNTTELLEQARAARSRAYAPFSKFPVGAGLLTQSGRVFTGCNVENISFGLTICAERVAVFSAVAAGERAFEAIAIVAESKSTLAPCGACRQVLAEFAPNLRVISAQPEGVGVEFDLGDLLPMPRDGILGT